MKDCSATTHCADPDCDCHRADELLDPYCSQCLTEMYNEIRASGGPLPLQGLGWLDGLD